MQAKPASVRPVAQTRSGPVLGKRKSGALHFCGIPYAAPPSGAQRFKPAQPPAAWQEVRDCTRFGPAAPQLPTGGLTNRVPVKWDEDCLSLNVCTPAVDAGRRPALVWIHGGAYRSGQGAVPWYNGASFAQQGDVVVVSINYRLGALGFTDLSRFGKDYASSGVNGILDQILALEWVRDNIAAFGGDPARVAIAGESAGAFSVCTLLGSPQAEGLFQRAIAQSGAAHFTLPAEAGERVASLLLEELAVETMEALQAKTPLEILQAQERADARFYKEGIGKGVSAFYPVEGNEVLPKPLLTLLAEGQGAGLPLLTGTNKDESTLFVMEAVDEAALQRQAQRFGGGERLAEAYQSLYPGASVTDLYVKMNTDFTFRVPALRLAELRQRGAAPTWLYQFDWESRAPHLRATHALEIPFVFNTLDAAGVDVFIGPGPSPQPLADEMHQVWTDFVHGRAPGWPAYDTGSRSVRHFGAEPALVEDGDAAVNALWQGVR